MPNLEVPYYYPLGITVLDISAPNHADPSRLRSSTGCVCNVVCASKGGRRAQPWCNTLVVVPYRLASLSERTRQRHGLLYWGS